MRLLIGVVVSAITQKSTVDAEVGSKNYSIFIVVDKTANLFSTLQSKGPVSVLLNLNFKGFSINWFTYLFFALCFFFFYLLVKLFVCVLMSFFFYWMFVLYYWLYICRSDVRMLIDFVRHSLVSCDQVALCSKLNLLSCSVCSLMYWLLFYSYFSLYWINTWM